MRRLFIKSIKQREDLEALSRLQNKLQKKDKIKLRIGYMLAFMLIGLFIFYIINFAATFGNSMTNSWMYIFCFSVFYDLVISQLVKTALRFTFILILGSTNNLCKCFRTIFVLFISKDLLLSFK
jgi:hypothetical protein